MHFDLVFKNVIVIPSYFSVSNFSYNKEYNIFYGDMRFIFLNMQYINYLHCSMVEEGSRKVAWMIKERIFLYAVTFNFLLI